MTVSFVAMKTISMVPGDRLREVRNLDLFGSGVDKRRVSNSDFSPNESSYDVNVTRRSVDSILDHKIRTEMGGQ